MSGRLSAALAVLLGAAAYFLSARLAYLFAVPGGVVTLWFPSGLMLGLFLASPRSRWPWLVAATLIGSAASDTVSGYPAGFVVAAALANAAESWGVAWFVTRALPSPVHLASVRSVALFAVRGPILANAVTAWVGALALHWWFHRSLGSAWLVWWSGDGLGMLIVTPVLLVWRGSGEAWRSRKPLVVAEVTILLVLLLVVSQLAVGPSQSWGFRPQPYMVFPLLFWAALRFSLRGAAMATVVVATVAVWNAALGTGPFIGGVRSNVQSAMQVYMYLALSSQSALILAAVLAERAEAKRRLAESEDRYRGVVSAATDAIVTIGADSRIEFANPAVERIFGYKPEELVGNDLTMLMPPELRDRHKAGIARYLATGQRHIEWQAIALPGLHRAGHSLPIEISFGELTVNGRQLFTGIIRDVSEKHAARQALQLAEERMRFALEASQVGIWEVNLTNGTAYWSETCEVMHGLPPGSFGGSNDAFLAAVHADDRENVREAIDRAVKEQTDARLDYRVALPDGMIRHIRSSGRFFYDEKGAPIRGAGVAVDVTGQRLLEEQVRQSQKMEVLGQLAGGVAHDFNNLLTAIHGYGSLLMEESHPDSATRRDLGEILLAAQRAESLTRQLLAFSRRQIISPRVFDLSNLVRRMQPMLERLIGEHIRIGVHTPAGVVHVRADPGQMEQVILNLALNARDAMPRGGVIDIEVAHGVPGFVSLTVRDTGIGMSEFIAARLFEPFFTTKPAGKGTGLGLATVHGIVEQSGGTIGVKTALGSGTTFTVSLPRVQESTAEADRGVGASVRRRTETILLVEDDDALRKLVRRILEGGGFSVHAASTPREALAISERSEVPIHLLVTDLVLPEMSGRELAEAVVAGRPSVKVLFMSGYTDDEVLRHGVHQRGVHFLQKPFDPLTLLTRVIDVLESRG